MFNLKPIALVSGTVTCAVGFFLFIPLITELVYRTESWQSYAVPILLYLIVGGSLVITNKNINLKISLKDAFIITVLSWMLITFLCAVPFVYTTVDLSVVDALFESMSGVTTTGSTVLNNIEDLPKGIVMWRAFLQWLGGIGIVVIALFILPFLRIGGMQLFHLEGDDPYDKTLPKMSSVIKRIFFIYSSFTIILIFLYYIFGMIFFEAIIHSFTTISTGGFSTRDSSFAYFNNEILVIAIFFMIIGSLPFLVLVQTNFKNLLALYRDHQVRAFILILIIAIVLIFYFANRYIDGNFFNKIITVAFNTISIISGTGFTSDNYENWGNYASVLFLILMFVGGCAGSTTGGLKIFRFQILFKYLNLHLKKMLKPHVVTTSQFNGKKIIPKI